MLKSKTINILLILTSLFVYLEWGGNNNMFLYQGEWEILNNVMNEPRSVLHPFVLLPLGGQIILLVTLFQKEPGKVLTRIGIIGLGILIVFIFLIGLWKFNYKVMLSSLPFIIVSIFALKKR